VYPFDKNSISTVHGKIKEEFITVILEVSHFLILLKKLIFMKAIGRASHPMFKDYIEVKDSRSMSWKTNYQCLKSLSWLSRFCCQITSYLLEESIVIDWEIRCNARSTL